MIKQSGITLDQQIRRLTQASGEFKGMITDEMEKIAPQIEERMVSYSDMQKNRITEDMVNAMEVEVAKTGTQIRFGFLRDLQLYYQLQTISGFTHRGGKFIAPSLAIADTKQDFIPVMREAAKRIRRNFMQRLRRRG